VARLAELEAYRPQIVLYILLLLLCINVLFRYLFCLFISFSFFNIFLYLFIFCFDIFTSCDLFFYFARGFKVFYLCMLIFLYMVYCSTLSFSIVYYSLYCLFYIVMPIL